MILNDATISHYRSAIIPIETLKKMVGINEKYLKEKPTWYMIDGKLKYFKIRNDYRLFTEQFFSKLGKQIFGLDTLEYEVACVRTQDTTISQNREIKKNGLLSSNYQTPCNNYYMISELLNPDISDLIAYSGYSLENVLKFFKHILIEKDFIRVKDFLIRLFIADAYTLQADRNYHNIGFEIPKIEGINYKQRLRPEQLILNTSAGKCCVMENGLAKLKGIKPSKVYDSEKILGIDHKNVLLHRPGMTWKPLFPYSNDLLFDTQEEADETCMTDYDGIDPNLASLYMNFPKEAIGHMERAAYDDEYRKIIEEFAKNNSQINLLPGTKKYVENVLEERRREFQKVLTYFK